MKTTITHAERRQIAESILDARQLLVGVDDHERLIALTLGFNPGDDRDAITDAITDTIGVPTATVDDLLERLGIDVSEDVA